MPADYVACRDSLIKKGVSEKTAKRRCAIWFYKKHGVSVNEAHKKGDGAFPDAPKLDEEDWSAMELISSDLDKIPNQVTSTETSNAIKPSAHGDEEIFDVQAVDMDFLDEFGIVEIVATRVGATAYTSNGLAVTWTEKVLAKRAGTWKFGNVSINHNGKTYGKIIDSFFEDKSLKQVVKVNDELKGWLKQFGKSVEVSIEAIKVKINKMMDINDAFGSGVTFVFPPETAACKAAEGCGIIGFDVNAVRHTPPESGNLPEGGKKVLDAAYNACRKKYSSESAEDKTRCSKIAWSAVHKAGYSKDKDGNWKKAAGSVPDDQFDIESFMKDCECEGETPIEGTIITNASNPWFTNINSTVVSSGDYYIPGYTDWNPNIKITWTTSSAETPNNIDEENKNGDGKAVEDHLDSLNGKTETEITAILEELDGAKLSYQQRKDLPESAFCGPDRSFPAHDAAHVRNGLARLSQSKGLSESQKSRIHSCLVSRAKKYGIEVSESKGTIVEVNTEAKGDNMVEEQKPAETICAKKHESIVKEKDSQIEALKKELDVLKATVAQFNSEKKTKLLETMNKEYGLDTKIYESKEISVIEDILATLKAVKAKEASEPEVNSGAEVKGTEQVTNPAGNAASQAIEEAAKKAEEESKKQAEEIARINIRAESFDGKKR